MIKNEKYVLNIFFACLFVFILDQAIIIPLGPDLIKAFNIPGNMFGGVIGAYAAASATSSVLSMLVLNLINRKSVLLISLTGILFADIFSALAQSFHMLIFSRIISGLFSGAIYPIIYSTVADLFPEDKRGSALGKMAMASSLVIVLGLPFSLEIARLFSWRAPFFFTSALLLPLIISIYFTFKINNAYTKKYIFLSPNWLINIRISIFCFIKNWPVLISLFISFINTTFFIMFVPILPVFFIYNMKMQRENLSIVYAIGGLLAVLTSKKIGVFIDKYGYREAAVLSLIFIFIFFIIMLNSSQNIYFPFIFYPIFTFLRTVSPVSFGKMYSLVPKPEDRTSYYSLQKIFSDIGYFLGAFLGERLLNTASDGSIVGMKAIFILSGIFCLISIFLVYILDIVFITKNFNLNRNNPSNYN
ncbi:MFS transporter [Fluviispira multicolorata]|uniref:MFS transporter n=1 Tax=Fluviispira multicolorata TaxID=2654512 RepID=A0A833JEB1_9BACT|nr:MFS transporter [Fluviispira multicolorata]KAB8032279.1 MFS transporter [Fluviispira multicolorata]